MARKIQPRSKVPKPKKGQSSEDYWRERETRQRAANIHDEARYASRINDIFQSTQDSIQQEIESFYQRYAGKEGIDIAEARRMVSKIDMEKYERLAAQYVKAAHEGGREAAFSDEANEQMRLYNATMRINRLEMLKARCGIRAMEGYRLADQLINEALEERAYSEYYRLAGILGNSVQFNETMVRSIVDASYQNAIWSKRLWINQALLSERIGAQIAQGILTGKGSDVLARNIQKLTGQSTYVCQRLMRTELRRVQTAAAEQSMKDNGVTAYKFLVANGVNPCDECVALDGKVFKISEMEIGKNAPPKHPLCHCCTCPALDEENWQRWLDGPAQAGVPWAEFEERAVERDYEKHAGGTNPNSIVYSMNSPHINNSEETVEQFYKELKIETEIKDIEESVKECIRHIPERDLEILLEHRIIIRDGNKHAFERNPIYIGKTEYHVITINPNDKRPFVFAHEFAHLAQKVNALQSDKEFSKLLVKYYDSATGRGYLPTNKGYDLVLLSPKSVVAYQGRTYIKEETTRAPVIKPEDLVEYISVGYEVYVGDRTILENKDPELYNYFERRGLR